MCESLKKQKAVRCSDREELASARLSSTAGAGSEQRIYQPLQHPLNTLK